MTGADSRAIPRFCSSCDRAAADDSPLCGDCGERTIEQGYCSICERFWRLPAGSPCPKHDLKLDAEPPRSEFSGGIGHPGRWVTVETFINALKAEVPRIRLEAEGIPTQVEGERMGSHSMYPVATGGVKLQVPESLANEARIVLSQTWSPVGSIVDDDLDDAWDELAPEPGAIRRPVMKIAVLVIMFGPPILAMASRWLRL